MKICARCGVECSNFGPDKRSKDGLKSWCRPCYAAYEDERQDSWKSRCPKLYGITPEQYAEKRAAQQGRCKICDRERPLHLDHNHATGDLRDFLCEDCNLGLGRFQDDPKLLIAASEYLLRHGGRK